MRNEDEIPEEAGSSDEDLLRTRRNMLRIGALGAAAVVTVRPGIAHAAVSALTCQIPVPQPSQAGKWIKSDGTVVSANANGAFAPPSRPLWGEEVKNSMKYGINYSGASTEKATAYNNYIKKLTVGQQGYTCYVSLQNPARK